MQNVLLSQTIIWTHVIRTNVLYKTLMIWPIFEGYEFRVIDDTAATLFGPKRQNFVT